MVVVERPLPIPKIVEHGADVVEGGGFACPVSDLAADGEGLVVVVERPLPIPKRVEHAADVGEGGGFACPVTDVTVGGEGLVVVVERPLPIPKTVEHAADVVEGGGFACPVSDVTVGWGGLGGSGRAPPADPQDLSSTWPMLLRVAASPARSPMSRRMGRAWW